MRSVKCTLDENEFRTITDEAKKLGVHRSDLIRTKITSASKAAPAPAATPTPSTGAPTCAEYLSIVNSVQRRMGNAISPSQVEQCVAITLKCMHG